MSIFFAFVRNVPDTHVLCFRNSVCYLIAYPISGKKRWRVRSLKGSLSFNWQFLVISIVIDCDGKHCYEHLEKKYDFDEN